MNYAKPRMTDVIATIAFWAGVPLDEALAFQSHKPRAVMVRNVAAFVLHDLMDKSYPEIAKEFKTRHSTIIGQRQAMAAKLREVAAALDKEAELMGAV